jgi:hypothetical protein
MAPRCVRRWTARSHGRGQRGKDDLAALAADPEHPVAVLLGDVFDVAAGGLEDPQAQEPQHRDQREVVSVRRGPGGGEQRLELQVGQSQGRGLRRHVGSADVVGGECSRAPSMTQVR